MKFWSSSPLREEKPAWAPLRIVARGMCCAVGHRAPAACAAMAARFNHFRETEFISGTGDPILGAALFGVDTWGAERLRLMLHAVVAEAMQEHEASMANTALVVLSAEPGRPGNPAAMLAETLEELADIRGFHPASRMCSYGKAGMAQALQECAAILLSELRSPQFVLLVGIDSLLDAGTIQLMLSQQRLLTADNADGLIPGEGAAALLLSVHDGDANRASLWVDGAAWSDDLWRLEGDEPMRATALTQAIRNAAQQANAAVADLDFHASGMTGEGWYAREVGLALSRTIERRKTSFPHEMVARGVGETGAASSVLTLAWLADAMADADLTPGHAGLLHFAALDGRRSAAVIRYRTPV